MYTYAKTSSYDLNRYDFYLSIMLNKADKQEKKKRGNDPTVQR